MDPSPPDTANSHPPAWRFHARRIALIYAGFASLWILTSDRAMFHFLGDYQNIVWINIAKGVFFVMITSILLWHLMRRMLMGLERSQAELADREREIRKSRARLRALLTHLEQAREEERVRISREVHDVLGQLLTGMKMNLKWITQRIPENGQEPERLIAKLSETDSFANAILASIQEIAHDLRPGILDRFGLVPALRFEAERFSKRAGIPSQFNSVTESIRLPAQQNIHVFRIVQEMLTNVARHAQPTMVAIHLSRRGDECVITVSDDGVGIAADKISDPTSLGLLGMTERAMLLGGEVSVRPSGSKGTTASLTFKETTA